MSLCGECLFENLTIKIFPSCKCCTAALECQISFNLHHTDSSKAQRLLQIAEASVSNVLPTGSIIGSSGFFAPSRCIIAIIAPLFRQMPRSPHTFGHPIQFTSWASHKLFSATEYCPLLHSWHFNIEPDLHRRDFQGFVGDSYQMISCWWCIYVWLVEFELILWRGLTAWWFSLWVVSPSSSFYANP